MTLLSDLRQTLGNENVLEEPLELYIYSKDASLMRGEGAERNRFYAARDLT